jgi:hypothetical protein
MGLSQAAPRGIPPVRGVLASLRAHWLLLTVMAAASAARAAVAFAYSPAIFFGDSWAYLDLAFEGWPVGIAPDRPSGYPFLIHLLSAAGPSLATITTAQHLAGLTVAVLVYLLLLRVRLPRVVAAAAAAVVALDGYAIALEQQVMAEAFFTLALVASLYLAVGRDRGPWALAASGALLAAAATMRTAALFAIPVWVAYMLWAHGRGRLTATAVAALLVPLLAYCTMQTLHSGEFGFTQADGWFLYGRVGQFADCGGADIPAQARPLCARTQRDRSEGAAFHVWNADGPARRMFGGMSRDPQAQERSNRILRAFALAIIRDRPLRYAREVVADFGRYFRPGEMSSGNSDLALTLPVRGRLVSRNELVADRYFPSYQPKVREPAGSFARVYQRAVHTPRWLLGPLALASALSLLLTMLARRRFSLPRRRESFLLCGAGLAMLLGSAAGSGFVLRYLLPAVPLLVCGGVAAAADLAVLARRAQAAISERLSSARTSPALASRIRPGQAPARSRPAAARGPALLLARRPPQAPR